MKFVIVCDRAPRGPAVSAKFPSYYWENTAMPIAKIHVLEGRYDKDRLDKVSQAVQAALNNTLGVPFEDFHQLIYEFPRDHFRHTPSFVGMKYTDDLILLDVTFIEGRSKEKRLSLLKDLNLQVSSAAKLSPDDLVITIYEASGENFRLAADSPSALMQCEGSDPEAGEASS